MDRVREQLHMDTAYAMGLTGKNINVSAYRETGSLVGNITGAIVKDTHVIGATVSGTSRVGAMAGYVDKSQMMECSANGQTSATEAAVGGFVGEIVNVCADESVITDGRIDPKKLKPIAFDPCNNTYTGLGNVVGKAFGDGLKLK